MSRQTLRSAIEFILINFATPIAFYITFRIWGAKPAIAFAIATTLIQFAYHKLQKLDLGPFFIIASGFTVFFGVIDLLIASPRFFRLEPFFHNVVVGLVFLYSSFTSRPLVAWFAEGLPSWLKPDPKDLNRPYLKRVTLAWAFYLLAKAALYLYLAFEVDLGSLIVLRSMIGGGSLALMLAGEFVYRTWLKRT